MPKMCDFTDRGDCAAKIDSACICCQPGYRAAKRSSVKYASEEEARADWMTIHPHYRTQERLAEMLAFVDIKSEDNNR